MKCSFTNCRPASAHLLKVYFRIKFNSFFENTQGGFCCIIWRKCIIWVKVFKNGPGKIFGRQPLKNLKWYMVSLSRPYHFKFMKGCPPKFYFGRISAQYCILYILYSIYSNQVTGFFMKFNSSLNWIKISKMCPIFNQKDFFARCTII